METDKTDEKYNEVEELLGEITIATAGNSCAVVPTQRSALPGFEPISAYEYNKSSSSSELFNFITTPEAREDGKRNSVECNTLSRTLFDLDGHSQYHHEALTSVNQNASWLQDEQYLALAFQNMSFKDTINGNLANPFFERSQSSFNNSFSPDGNYSACLNQLCSGFEPLEMPTHLPHSVLNEVQCPNLISEGYPSFMASYRPNMHSGILGHDDATLLNRNFHHPTSVLGDHNDQWQVFPAYSASLPVNHGTDTFFQPGVSFRGFEFPASPHVQEYYMASPYYPNLTHRPLNQYDISCSDIQYERNYRNLSQYRYFNHLGNQCLDRHILNSRNEPLLGGEAKPCFHMPSTQQVGLVNPDFHWNGNMVRERNDQLEPSLLSKNLGSCHLNQSSPSLLGNNLHSYHLNQSSGQCENLLLQQGNKSFSSGFYCPGISSYKNQAVGRFGKEIVPEKILTRSHGGNSLQIFESGSILSSQFPDQASKTRRVSPNINVHCSVFQCDGSVNLDVWRSQGSSPDNSDKKHDLKSRLNYDSLDNVMQKIHIFARDQNCCRFLQSIFDKGNREDFDKMFLAIDNHLTELATDPFGNYFIQKLIEVCTEEQLTHIIHKISHIGGELRQISFNQHGTRVVQKIIETMKAPEQYSMIVTALKPDILSLMKNNNASHVAHRCLENLPHEYREFLFEAAVDNCIDLARDSHGCCLIQKYLSDMDGEPKFRLVCKLAYKARDLSENPYGNYVVQYILDRDVPWATTKILDHLEGHYRSLSVQKFSSNVVEKCLKFAGDGRLGTIIWELIKDSQFVEIVQDPYGNYVIQSALRECKGALRAALIEAIRPHEPALLDNRYGRKVLSCPYYGK